MPQVRGLFFLSLLLMLLCTAMAASGQAPGTTAVVAINGDPSPDGNGTLSSPETPVLQNGGNAVFAATLQAESARVETGIFSGNGTPGSLVLRV
jgi:hypothetical protein